MSSAAPKPPSSSTSSSSSKPPRPPFFKFPNSNLNPHHKPRAIIVNHKNHALSRATFLTWSQLLWRRARRLKQLSKCYRHHYWAMMEDLRARHKDYYWDYGVSPCLEEPEQQPEDKDSGGDDNNNNGAAEGCGESVGLKHIQRCLFVGCKLKAMALTSFCHLHILSDSKQKLYKPCDYVIKSAQAGPITCGKPILRSTVPSLCAPHLQKAQKHVAKALKKAGLNVSSSSKLAPKFHVVVAEYVHQIQAKRRNALKNSKSEVVVKEEIAS